MRTCREGNGKCEGRKSYAERDLELLAAARRLHRRSPKRGRRSLRNIARELAVMGFVNKRGAPYSASCVKSMVDGALPVLRVTTSLEEANQSVSQSRRPARMR
jgi:hypothetical protein